MKILLGNINTKMERVNILKSTIANKSLHQDINDINVKIVIYYTSKNLVAKRRRLPHGDIYIFNWTSLEWKTHSQINRILINMI
jgi:siroheme synthase